MRYLLFISLILSGCAYNETIIKADNGSTVNCTNAVDKPVTLDKVGSAEGNKVPVMP